MLATLAFLLTGSAIGSLVGADDPIALSPREIAERVSDAVVLIEAEGHDATAQGTGFLVDDGVIVTCLHVVEGAIAVAASLRDGTKLEDLFVRAFDVERDLVVLEADLRTAGMGLSIVEFGATDLVEPGSRILVISNPLGLEHTVTTGIVSAWREPSEDDPDNARGDPATGLGLPQVRLLQISATISPGSSGGPVMNDRAEVIGVATSGILWGTVGLNFAVPVDALPALLDEDDSMDLESFGERVEEIRLELARPHFEDGRLAYQREELEESIRHLERALQLFPRYVDALVLSGAIAVDEGQIDVAEERLTLASEIDEYNVDAWYYLGETYRLTAVVSGDLADLARAQAAFETALEIDPRHGKAAFRLALIRLSKGDSDQAEQLLVSAIENEPGFADAHYVLGEIYLEADRMDEAIEAFEQALWEDDTHAMSHFGLVRVYLVLEISSHVALPPDGLAAKHWEEFLRLTEGDPSFAEQREAAIAAVRQHFPQLLE
jgi:S1-C subfamily serine protease